MVPRVHKCLKFFRVLKDHKDQVNRQLEGEMLSNDGRESVAIGRLLATAGLERRVRN